MMLCATAWRNLVSIAQTKNLRKSFIMQILSTLAVFGRYTRIAALAVFELQALIL
jgi:hypothetical protein